MYISGLSQWTFNKLGYQHAKHTQPQVATARSHRNTLGLPIGRPTGGPAPDFFTDQWAACFRTQAPILPAMVEQPAIRRLTPIGGDHPKCVPADFPDSAVKLLALLRVYLTCTDCRVQARPPENLVSHPISNSREGLLHEQDGLDRRPGAALQEGAHQQLRKVLRQNFRG